MFSRKLLFLILLFSAITVCYAGEVSVSADVSSSRIGVDDQLILTVRVSGASGSFDSPDMGGIKDFRVVGSSSSSRISITNGRMESSKELIFTLLPLKKGTLEIPSLKIRHEGQLYATNPISIEVVEGSLGNQTSPRGLSQQQQQDRGRETADSGNGIMLKAETGKRSVYIGEPVYIEYNIYTRYPVSGGEVVEMPDFKDFITEDIEIKESEQQKQKVLNNISYGVIPVVRKLLFPAKTGVIKIDPMVISLRVRTRSNDPFDFFSGFGREEVIYRRTEPLDIEIKALPGEGKPENFSGAVGKYSISSSVNTREIAVNDALTFEIQYTGSGNINSLTSPVIPDLPDFEVHTPEVVRDVMFRNGTMEGKLSWKYILIPKVAGSHEIPSVELSYFDRQEGRYKTATAPSIPVTVTGTADSVTVAEGKRNVVSLLEDIKYIKPLAGSLKNHRTVFMTSKTLTMLTALPLLLNIIFFVFVALRTKRASSVNIIKAKKASAKAIRRIKGAKGSDLFTTVWDSLNEYASDRLYLPKQGLTSDKIIEGFSNLGCPDKNIREFIILMETCEATRYSPSASDYSDNDIADRAVNAVVSLERSIKRK